MWRMWNVVNIYIQYETPVKQQQIQFAFVSYIDMLKWMAWFVIWYYFKEFIVIIQLKHIVGILSDIYVNSDWSIKNKLIRVNTSGRDSLKNILIWEG